MRVTWYIVVILSWVKLSKSHYDNSLKGHRAGVTIGIEISKVRRLSEPDVRLQ